MIKGLEKISLIRYAIIASGMALLFAEPVSAVSPRVSSYTVACIEFEPGSSKLTENGLATLDNIINVFSGRHLPAKISINAPYLGGQIDPSDDEFRKEVSGWLDLSHARTKEVVDRILKSSDSVKSVSVMNLPRDHCPTLWLHVELPAGLPDLKCDKASCQPDK